MSSPRRRMCALMSHTIFSPLLVIALAMASAPAEAQKETLDALFEETWAFRLQEDPLRATSVGEHAYGDRLPGVTAEDQRRRDEYYHGVLARLDAIDRDGLSGSDRLNYDMFQLNRNTTTSRNSSSRDTSCPSTPTPAFISVSRVCRAGYRWRRSRITKTTSSA